MVKDFAELDDESNWEFEHVNIWSLSCRLWCVEQKCSQFWPNYLQHIQHNDESLF